MSPQYNLVLADGNAWAIEGGDEQAMEVVSQLGVAMRLCSQPPSSGVSPAPGTGRGAAEPGACRRAARRLLVVSDNHSTSGEDLVCVLPSVEGEVGLYIHLFQVSLVIAREVQRRGGVLLHGALAEWQGHGVLLAAPGSTGKTTASSRLPYPWRSLCDDAALVVRDEKGAYRAHPWPTWSRFLPGGPGGSWDVQQSVPLRGIFFLARAEDDWVESVGAGKAVTLLLESAEQASHAMGRDLDLEGVRALRLERFDNLCALAKSVPAYILHLSLSGAFWQEIERVLLKDEG